MSHTRSFLLAGSSLLALSVAAHAQSSENTPVVELDPITVSLVEDGQENIESTGGVVISQEDIEILNPQNLSELFSRESSVTVSGGGGPSQRVHVFGMEQSNLAVSVDGVPDVATSWHHTGSSVIDPAFLKAVEVEAGAAAADAGFAAGAGAIRYETVDAEDLLAPGQEIGGRVNLSYGSNGQGAAGSLATYGRADGFDWLVMIHKQDGEDYENGDGETILGTAPATAGALMKFGYEFEDHRLELNYQRDQDHDDRTIKMNLGLASDTTLYPMDVTSDRLSLTYTTTAPTAAWDPTVQIYASQFGYERPDYLPGGTNGDMILDEDQFGGKLENVFGLAFGTLTTGLDFNQHDYQSYAYEDTPTRNFSTTQIGAYMQGRFAFDNGVDISAGLRADTMRFTDWNNQRFTDSGLSANATISYEFAPGLEVFAGASQTWMGYYLAEYGYIHARNDTFATREDFGPTTAQNVKVGFNASRGAWQGGITYFDTRIDDMTAFNWDSSNYYLYNAVDRRSKGVTLNGAYSWGSGRAGLTYTNADTTEDGAETLPGGGSFVPVGQTATLYVDQEIAQYDLRVGGAVEWAGSLDGDSWGTFEPLDSYTVVNAYAEWSPEELQGAVLRLGVDNLFNETYFERSSYATNSARGGIEPIYAPGRTVSFAVTKAF